MPELSLNFVWTWAYS